MHETLAGGGDKDVRRIEKYEKRHGVLWPVDLEVFQFLFHYQTPGPKPKGPVQGSCEPMRPTPSSRAYAPPSRHSRARGIQGLRVWSLWFRV